jgi:hypothetical protein
MVSSSGRMPGFLGSRVRIMKIAMIHYRNLAILSEKGDLAADRIFASEAAREGGAATQAKKVSDSHFPVTG